MKDHNCPNCGAPITGNICPYCGTRFKKDGLDYVIVSAPQAKVLEACVAVPFQSKMYMSEKAIAEYTLQELRNKIAEGLEGLLTIQTCDDPVQMRTVVRGRIRVFPPDVYF